MLAVIHGATGEDWGGDQLLLARPRGDGIDLFAPGWPALDRAARLDRMRAAVARLVAGGPAATLHWSFSPVTIAGGDAAALGARWDETGEPPVFSLIDFDIVAGSRDDERLVTIGLRRIVGREIETAYPADKRVLVMHIVAQLARSCLTRDDLSDRFEVATEFGSAMATRRSRGFIEHLPVLFVDAFDWSRIV